MKRWTLASSALLAGGLFYAGASIGDPAPQSAQQRFPTPPKAAVGVADLRGTWAGTYSSNLVAPTSVSLIFQQLGATVTGTYLSANGAQGVMFGTASPHQAELTAQQTTPSCPGSFSMPVQVQGTTMTWKFVGKDCLGDENGAGKAARQSRR
ncbi:MAG TPA: hypothetical protein VKY89_21220 [Thermoanaerobaculia bacterium]|nr:hypothetical protein [Thermoanaerobaculia bacterium]